MRGRIGLAAFGLLALGVGVAHADPLKIRGAWVAPVANWASIWLQKKDLAKHFGQSYVFEPSRYAGTPPMITAIANNELEIGDLAFSTLPIAIENAGMDDIRVIADDFQDGVSGYYSNEFDVLADGPIKKVEDLKGKVVATNAAGSGVDVAMRAMLRKHGLEANRDYTIVEAPFPAMRAMLAEKKVDMIPAVLPFSLDPELKKIAHAVVHHRRRGRALRSSSCGRRASRSSTRIAPRSSIFWKTRCASRTGISIPRTTMLPPRSPRNSPNSRLSGSAGSSPRTTITAIPTCCRTSTRCRRTST